MTQFDPSILTPEDLKIARKVLGWDYERGFRGKALERPDLTIAPDGKPYLHRWYLTPRRIGPTVGNVYFHIQVDHDPERPLHDHPWDNQSVILAGGYEEHLQVAPPYGIINIHQRHPGETIFRRAEEAHRLFLPADVPYTMTLFSTGPKRRDWGFWAKEGFVNQADVVTVTADGQSIWKDKRP